MSRISVWQMDFARIDDFLLLQSEIPVDNNFVIDRNQVAANLVPRAGEERRESWIVYSDSTPAASVTASIGKRALLTGNKRVAFFSNFMAKNDLVAVKVLFESVGKWCRRYGASVVRGPMSSSLSDYRGILVSGYDEPPCLGLAHNPEYYDLLLKSAGLSKAMDMFSYRIETGALDKVSRVARFARLRNRGMIVRNFDVNNSEQEIKDIVGIYNRAWENHWSFIPVTERDFSLALEAMQYFFDPEMVKLAVVNGRTVGMMVSVPNVFDPQVRETGKPIHARAMLFGVDVKYQKRGIDAILMDEAIKMCREKGVLAYEVGWVLESNVHWRRQLENACRNCLMGTRRYRVYEYIVE